MQHLELFILALEPYNPTISRYTVSTTHNVGSYTAYELGNAFTYLLPVELVSCMFMRKNQIYAQLMTERLHIMIISNNIQVYRWILVF